MACSPPPGNPGFCGQRKETILKNKLSHPTPVGGCGAPLPVESGGGGSGSGPAPQPLDEGEHVGMAMSNSSYTLLHRFVITQETLEEKADIINEF